MKRISHPLAQGTVAISLLLTLLVGCEEETAAAVKVDFPATTPYIPRTKGENAYDAYILAANRLAKDCADHQDRVNFTDSQTQNLRKCAAPSLQNLLAATKRPATVIHVPQDPFKPKPQHLGLVLFAKVLEAETQDAVENRDHPRIVDLLLASTKLAVDLTAGDASDASLGYTLAERTRIPALSVLAELPPEQLLRLSEGLDQILADRPSLQTTINNEGQNFEVGIQFVRAADLSRDYELLEAAMYKSVLPAIKHLRGLSLQEKETYYAGFEAEAKTTVAHYLAESEKPAVDRTELEFDQGDDRPWRRFSTQIFGTLGPLLKLNDDFVATTRLVALTARAQHGVKTTGRAPLTFPGLSAEAKIDPYTGKAFPYRVAGSEFRVYSVGPDGRDDGGVDDIEAGQDLVLDVYPD